MRACDLRGGWRVMAALVCVGCFGNSPPPVGAQEKPAAVVPAPAPRIKAAEQLSGDRYAVIVGVNDYADENIPDLRLAERDAQAVYDLLTNASIGGVPARNAALLLGKNATTRKVKSAFSKLREAPKKSTIFLYFSGHGMKDRGDGFWMTQDAEVDDLVASALSDLELRKLLGDIQAERVIVMIDACYAAATVHGSKDAPKGLNDLLAKFTGKGHAILSAAGDGEEALEADSLKHSVFTYFLLEGLKGQADANQDGVVVLPELTTYLDDHVADEARKRKGIQKPVVDFKEVQEPAKFQLVIDPVRLSAITAAATNRQATYDRRMAKVRELLVADKLTDELAREAKSLFGADPAKLSKDDLLVLAEYVNVVEGKLAPDKLAKVIGLIRATPATTTPSTPTVTTNGSWIGTKAGDVREDNSLKLKLIWCPPGKFTMGSPKTETDLANDDDQVSVTLTQGFWLGKFEVTQAEYRQLIGTNPSYFSAQGEGKSSVSGLETGRFPVETVSWDEARAFCTKLTSQEQAAGRLPAGWIRPAHRGPVGVRLPGRDDHGHSVRRPVEQRRGEFQRGLSVQWGSKWTERWAAEGRRELQTERLGTVRHARERLGVVPGRVCGEPARWQRPGGVNPGLFPRPSRWQLERQRRELPVGVPQRGRPGGPAPVHGLPPGRSSREQVSKCK